MGEPLNLFPPRAAIGRVDDRGDVYMTLEFTRALAVLLARVGGPVGNGVDDLAAEMAASSSALGLHLARTVEQLEHEIAQATSVLAALAEFRKHLDGLEMAGATATVPTDWEHPGKIGAATPNTARFVTVNRVAIAEPATRAALVLHDRKTFTVENTLGLAGTDGASLVIGDGGTLGTAAFMNANVFAGRSNAALGPAATDAATTQALANNIRAALLGVGIGT